MNILLHGAVYIFIQSNFVCNLLSSVLFIINMPGLLLRITFISIGRWHPRTGYYHNHHSTTITSAAAAASSVQIFTLSIYTDTYTDLRFGPELAQAALHDLDTDSSFTQNNTCEYHKHDTIL